MIRRFLWVCFCLLVFGCDQTIDPKQINEPCTRTSECVVGLACLAGVCMPATDGEVDAGSDSGS